MQYQSECPEALKSATNICKPFEKVFINAMKLFIATIPEYVNFLQMEHYRKFSKLTYNNYFENELVDWSVFKKSLVRKHLNNSKVWYPMRIGPHMATLFSTDRYSRQSMYLNIARHASGWSSALRDSKQHTGITNRPVQLT